MLIAFTEYAGIYDLDTCTPRETTWEGLVSHFSVHLRTVRKDSAPGFGPYVLQAPPAPCTRHRDGRPRSGPHRCDSCVREVTLAVFDVDVGTVREIARCDAALAQAGLARLWYSSHSYRPELERPPLRLVLPLAAPVASNAWPSTREAIAARFDIPCDLRQCGGLSHFYFAPSCPPDAHPLVDARPGNALDTRALPCPPPGLGMAPKRAPLPRLVDWEPPAEPEGPTDLGPLRHELARRASGLLRSHDARRKAKGEILRCVLAGKPLAAHGARNTTTTTAAGMVAYALPGQPLSALHGLLRPSIDAMIAAGSSLTHDEVERMILTAMRSKAEADERDRQVREYVAKQNEDRYASLPTS